mgnify:CR=1 FL=1
MRPGWKYAEWEQKGVPLRRNCAAGSPSDATGRGQPTGFGREATSVEDYVRAIRHGIDPEGKPIFMPAVVSTAYLSDEDLGLAVAGAWLLYTLRGVLAPVFFAFLIAYMLDPLVDRIEQSRLLRSR